MTSKRIKLARTLQMAERFAKYLHFILYTSVTFVVASTVETTFLTPQVQTMQSALLYFAKKLPIQNR